MIFKSKIVWKKVNEWRIGFRDKTANTWLMSLGLITAVAGQTDQ